MQRKTLRAAAIGAALLAAMAATALADSKDYEFQLVDKEVKHGEATIAVKLVHKPSGRAIPKLCLSRVFVSEPFSWPRTATGSPRKRANPPMMALSSP